jgi:hypothetical protein
MLPRIFMTPLAYRGKRVYGAGDPQRVVWAVAARSGCIGWGGGVLVAAACIPARRVARVDPLRGLRNEWGGAGEGDKAEARRPASARMRSGVGVSIDDAALPANSR